MLTTTTEYDAAGRVIRETDPMGHETSYTYDANGNQTSVTNEAGLTTFYSYDAANRVIEITEPGTPARITQYEYDGNGRRTREIAPDGTVTTFAYNTRGLLTQEVVDPDDPATSYDGLNLVTEYGYDALGRRTSVTNPRGFATTYGYDAADRLIRLGDGAGPTAALVTYGYDHAGRLISVTNPRGKTTTFVRDALGNPLIERDPLGREKTATFDLLGRLATATDPNGYAVHYEYDDAGRQTAVRDATTSTLLVGYGYDDLNRQTSMTDGRGTTTWSYGLSDQVEQVAGPEGTLTYDHDAAGRRTAMTLSGNRTVTYAYDPSGRLAEITDWDDRATSFVYEPSGALDTITRPNGVTTAFDYDAAGRLSAISHVNSSEVALAEYAYTLDANGNRTAVTITGTAVTTGIESYTYDDHDRLLSASYPGGGTALYQYDLNGNRTQVTSGSAVTDYFYDDADQLLELRDNATSDLITEFAYDANGNRTAATSGAVTNTYTYDWRNRLSSATVDGTSVSYEYAGDDLRTERSVAGGATETLLWDRQAGLPELVDDGTQVFLQFGDGELAEIGSSGDAVYPLADALGSNRATTDETGAVTGTADYDVWGNARASTGAQAGMGWTGELRDDATGLTYLRSRDYSPGGGRFLQRDTVSPNGPGSQGYNPYSYAAGNPATHTDPSGHAVDATTSPPA